MEANRLVKWDGEAQSFFDSVSDNSVVLDLVISHASISQTGHGFEDLVNSINCDELRKKIKKVRITDTAYLYRHCVKDYSGLSVVWFLNNQPSIDKLSVETEINSWEEGFRTDAFERWRRQITEDFSGNNDRLAQKFRELVIANSAVAAQKGTGTFDECVNFILEECAYICAHLKNTVIAYPMPFYDSVNEIIERYNLNIRHLLYKPSSYSRKRSNAYKKLAINQDVLVFLTEAVNANFFIIDRVGNYVYKNNVLSRIVGEAPADIVAPEAWEASINVMNTQKPMVIEERYNEKSYLSVKAPLIIEDEVEGVMGVAIDITDRKKKTELLIKNKEQETKIKDQREFGTFTGQVLHDIASPLASLEYIIKSSDIQPSHHVLLKEIAGSIKNIFGALQSKYLEYEKKSNSNQPGFILLSLAFEDILRNKKYEYKRIRK